MKSTFRGDSCSRISPPRDIFKLSIDTLLNCSEIMLACCTHSWFGLALIVFVGNFVFCYAAASPYAFVPVTATHRPSSQFGQVGELSGKLPLHRQTLGLRNQRPNSQIRSVRSFDTVAATKTLSRDITPIMNFCSLEDEADDQSDWQDPVAVFLYTCVSIQLLCMSLCGQMQVC